MYVLLNEKNKPLSNLPDMFTSLIPLYSSLTKNFPRCTFGYCEINERETGDGINTLACLSCFQASNTKFVNTKLVMVSVTMQNRWNNRISDGCVYAQIRKGLGMHLVTYSNHDTVPFLLIVPIKGRFV